MSDRADQLEEKIAALLRGIGESVEVYYETRNEGMEWYVGLADPHGAELPLHEHFATLGEGLDWLLEHKGLAAGKGPAEPGVGTCPTCGSPVRVYTGDEGTSSYEPLGGRPEE